MYLPIAPNLNKSKSKLNLSKIFLTPQSQILDTLLHYMKYMTPCPIQTSHILINHNSQSMRNYEMRLVLSERETQRNFIAIYRHTKTPLYVHHWYHEQHQVCIRFRDTFCPTSPFVLLQLCQGYGFISYKDPVLESHTHGPLHTTKRYKSSGVMSGERGGQQIGPPRPIQRSGKDSVREFRTSKL